METVFQQGDRVFDQQHGWGLVVRNENGKHYPILVEFEGGEKNTYSADGKISHAYEFPQLSFTEYDFIKGGFSQDRKNIAIIKCRIAEQNQYLIKCIIVGNEGIHINLRKEEYFLITAPTFSDACEKIEKKYEKLVIQSFDNCTL